LVSSFHLSVPEATPLPPLSHLLSSIRWLSLDKSSHLVCFLLKVIGIHLFVFVLCLQLMYWTGLDWAGLDHD
jgi:hypothetical protein